MKNGKCPSCGSNNVYTKPKGAQFGSEGLYVQTGGMVSKPLPYETYICTDCGLYETHITDEQKLAEVKQKWTKV